MENPFDLMRARRATRLRYTLTWPAGWPPVPFGNGALCHEHTGMRDEWVNLRNSGDDK